MFPLALLVAVGAILALTLGGKKGGAAPAPSPGGGGVQPSGPIGPGTVTPASGPSSPLGTLLPAGSTVSINSGDQYILVLQAADYDTSSFAASDWSAMGLQPGDTAGYVATALDSHFFPNGAGDWTEASFDNTSYPGYYLVTFTANVDGTAGGSMMSAFSLTNTTSGESTASTGDTGGATDSGAATNADSFGADLIGSPGGAAPQATFPIVDTGSGVPSFLRNPLQFSTSGGYVPPNRRRRVQPVAYRAGASGPSGGVAYGGHGGTLWPRDDDLS